MERQGGKRFSNHIEWIITTLVIVKNTFKTCQKTFWMKTKLYHVHDKNIFVFKNLNLGHLIFESII